MFTDVSEEHAAFRVVAKSADSKTFETRKPDNPFLLYFLLVYRNQSTVPRFLHPSCLPCEWHRSQYHSCWLMKPNGKKIKRS
jgi:hypothetical protein